MHSKPSPCDVVAVAKRLTARVPEVLVRARDGLDADLQLALSQQGGWNILSVLHTLAACAVVLRLPPDDPDLVFVREALAGYDYRPS